MYILYVFILLRLIDYKISYHIEGSFFTYCKYGFSSWIYSYGTAHYICKISSILLKFCARFWQISPKNFVIPPWISSIHLNFYHMKTVATLIFCRGNSMSNHLSHDTFTSEILFIFSLFVDSVEMINSWKFLPWTPYSSKVIKIWKSDQNGCSRIKSAILNLCFL